MIMSQLWLSGTLLMCLHVTLLGQIKLFYLISATLTMTNSFLTCKCTTVNTTRSLQHSMVWMWLITKRRLIFIYFSTCRMP